MQYTEVKEAYEELKAAQGVAAAAWENVLVVMNCEQAKLALAFEEIQREYNVAIAATNPR